MKGVVGRAGLYGGVFADVVNHFLSVHGIEWPVGRDGHFLQGGGSGFEQQGAECGVVGDGEGFEKVAVSDGRYAQYVVPGRNVVDLKIAVEVGRGSFDKGAVAAVEDAYIDVRGEFAVHAVSQRSHYFIGVADFFCLTLSALLSLAVLPTNGCCGRQMGRLAGCLGLPSADVCRQDRRVVR